MKSESEYQAFAMRGAKHSELNLRIVVVFPVCFLQITKRAYQPAFQFQIKNIVLSSASLLYLVITIQQGKFCGKALIKIDGIITCFTSSHHFESSDTGVLRVSDNWQIDWKIDAICGGDVQSPQFTSSNGWACKFWKFNFFWEGRLNKCQCFHFEFTCLRQTYIRWLFKGINCCWNTYRVIVTADIVPPDLCCVSTW